MGFFGRLFGGGAPAASMPRADAFSSGAGIVVNTPQQLEEALRTGFVSSSGIAVTPETAMRVAAVYGCVRLIAGAVATLPLHIKRRVDERTREDASDTSIWRVLRRKPNRWQKPAQFRRMLQAHVLLRGNGYARIVRGARGEVIELIPLHPDRVQAKQNDDLTVDYIWTTKSGQQVPIAGRDMLHLLCLTLDGVTGVTPITYARETIALSLGMDRHVGKVFSNGARISGALKTPNKLSTPAFDNLKTSIGEYKAGGDKEGDLLLLEEGLEFESMSLSPLDLQWIEARKLSRSELCMYYGVPPSMIGDNSGSDSNWGTGLEQKSNGFSAFALEDHLTMWEEGVTLDCIGDDEPDLYARFNRAALFKSDIKTRWGAYVQALQWGVSSPNEIRALEDQNPREGGDIYYPPPNTAGKSAKDAPDDPANAA